MSDPSDETADRSAGDSAAARRYRSAVETVDERPSASVRAAILAAAASEVGSQPRSIQVSALPPRRRWPLAAAATVLLSTLAVMLAVRTEREMPTFTAPAQESTAGTTAPPTVTTQDSEARRNLDATLPAASAPAAATEPVNPARSAAQDAAQKVAPAGPAPAARAGTERDIAGPAAAAPQSRTAEQTTASPVRDRAADAGEAHAKLTKEASAGGAPALSADAAVGMATAVPQEGAAKRKDERERQLAAAAPPAAAPMNSAVARLEGKVELSAAEWMKKIIELRAQGRDEQADLELKTFRERYPAVVIPTEALARSATR